MISEMTLAHWSLLLSIVSLLVSVGMAVQKLYDAYLDRFQIFGHALLTTEEGAPDIVTIVNNSARSVVLTNWKLAHIKQGFWRKRRSTIEDAEDDIFDVVIPARSVHQMKFDNGHKIPWGDHLADHGSVYLTLSIIGRRRPVSLLIHEPARLTPWSRLTRMMHFRR